MVADGQVQADGMENESRPSPTTFEALGVERFLVKSLNTMAIRTPTAVQTACIPPILEGRDCIGSAQTGSGKTIAFAVPILQALSRDPYGFFAVVLTPTRELAFQIYEQFKVLGLSLGCHTAVVVGGMDMMTQALELKKRPHVIIATPGRLADLIRSNQGEWSLARARFLVLDEADRLLTPTFAPDLSFIIDELPTEQKKQTLLFTATLTDAVMALQKREPAPGKQKPFVHVSGEAITTPAGLVQKYVFIPSQVRETYIVYLLMHLAELTGHEPLARKSTLKGDAAGKHRRGGGSDSSKKRKRGDDGNSKAEEEEQVRLPQSILFVPHCKTAAAFESILSQLARPIPCTALHSHMTQAERLASLDSFRRQSVPLLIATDVGSRGLDIPDVNVVVNWQVPRDPDDYVHRVGRTARAGRKGTAITVVTEHDVELVAKLEDRVGTKLDELELPEEPVLELLSSVTMAKRTAAIELHKSGYGQREETRKKKYQAAAGTKKRKKKQQQQAQEEAAAASARIDRSASHGL